MTSASELFNSRRSRFGRSSLLEFGEGEGGIDSSSHFYHNRISHSSNLRRHRHGNHHQTSAARRDHQRLDFDGSVPLPRRPTHLRHRPFLPEHDSGFFDQGSSQSASATVNNSENPNAIPDSFGFFGNGRLPGTVLLARERLLRRLRGLSLSENRQRNEVTLSTRHIDTTVEDDFRSGDINEWENEISTELAGGVPFTEVLTVEKSKRPPGLSQEAVKSLQVMVFKELEECEEKMMSRALECSICLESFMEGDKLICLTCGHRFHHHCLDPWVRICGDCPYCRMDILLTSCGGELPINELDLDSSGKILERVDY